jgi:ribosomal 50S subunit-recycling heat shock protein
VTREDLFFLSPRFAVYGLRPFNGSRLSRHGSRLTAFMRLDLFLRASRLVPRRTVAQELCEAGAVLVGGAAARASRTVREGDEITVRRRDRALTVRVRTLPQTKQVSRADAPSLYEIVSDIRLNDE